MDTNASGSWLVKRTLGRKKLQAKGLFRNQSILCFDIILQRNWPIKQCLLHIRVFFGGKTKRPCFDLFLHWLIKQIFGGKTKRPCFDLFLHWLIKQITDTCQNHFSRSYKNHSILSSGEMTILVTQVLIRPVK